MSLDFKNAETPEEAFWRKLPEKMIFKYEGWLIEVYHDRPLGGSKKCTQIGKARCKINSGYHTVSAPQKRLYTWL